MIDRPYWLGRIFEAWRTRPLVWLSGVRRVGKTTLSKAIPDAVYLNCDLVSSGRRLEDPEAFFSEVEPGSIVILDEIHRLTDPSLVLKTATDAFPGLRLLATGSSTLAASRKFSDTLTGRKWSIRLCPVLWDECLDGFSVRDLDTRLLRGGLPEQLLSDNWNQEFYSEWMDSFYARDIAELFNVRDRSGFLALLRLLLWQSGGLADYTKLSSECGVTRQTVKSYIEGMSIAHAVFPLKPFSGGGRREFTRRPKIYAFDTGFVAFCRGWDSVRQEDRGFLWEHLVLDTLRTAELESRLGYWRDKSGRELDFVLHRGNDRVDIFECKIDPDRFDPESLTVFRSNYPEGDNYLVCPHVHDEYIKNAAGLRLTVISTRNLLHHPTKPDTFD
jgi:predicted AAA+ superfamily ATPase